MYSGSFLCFISLKLEVIKTLPKNKQEDIASKRILKKKINEKLDNFLSTIQKLSKKKKRFINASKQKLSKNTQKPKTVGISSVLNLEKEGLPLSIFTSKLNKSVINIAIISANTYYVATKLKEA